MLEIWVVKVHVALGHSYLLGASACCGADSLLADFLHAGGPFPALQGFSAVCFLQYLLQIKN